MASLTSIASGRDDKMQLQLMDEIDGLCFPLVLFLLLEFGMDHTHWRTAHT